MHGLKSAANYIGASKLSSYAKMLEMYAKDNDGKSIDRDHPGLKPLYDEVAGSIEEFLRGRMKGNDEEEKKVDINKDELVAHTDELIRMIEDMDLDGVSRKADEMAGMKFDDEKIDKLINGIVKDASNFDFEEAGQKAQNIKSLLTQQN